MLVYSPFSVTQFLGNSSPQIPHEVLECMAMVFSGVTHVLAQSAEYECDIRSSENHRVHQASDSLLILSRVNSGIIVSRRPELLIIGHGNLLVLIRLFPESKLLEHCPEVLFLIKVKASGLPVTGDSYAENLMNLPQVLGVKPSRKLLKEPVDLP